MRGKKLKVDKEFASLPVMRYKKLVDLQGDFKTLAPEQLDNMCQSLMREGFAFPFFVWHDKIDNIAFILDGHQRQRALNVLEKEHGYNIPQLPYQLISANDKKHAIEKLLLLNSRYGTINPSTELLDLYDINLDELPVNIPEIDVELPDINEIVDFKTSVNFIISCEDENQLNEVQHALGTEANSMEAGRFIKKLI